MEGSHQTIGNIIRTFTIQEIDLDNEKFWEGILKYTMYTIRFAEHTKMQHALSQWYLVGTQSFIFTRKPTGIN